LATSFPWRQFVHPRYWLSWIGLAVLWLISQLPYCYAMRIGHAIGKMGYWLVPKRRHITEVNLQLCFPELTPVARISLCKASFAAVGEGMIEMALAWWAPPSKLEPLLHLQGMEHYEDAVKQQRGLLIVGAHFTTLDLIGRLISLRFEFCITYRETKDPLFNALMKFKRETFFTASVDRHDIRQFVKIIKNKGLIWYAPDQDYGAKYSVFAPFFGVPAATITATSRLAKMSNALILPCFQRRLPNYQGYVVEIHPAVENFPSGDEIVDATRINALIEQAIRKCPDQYLWQHRRFKTRPEGQARPY